MKQPKPLERPSSGPPWAPDPGPLGHLSLPAPGEAQRWWDSPLCLPWGSLHITGFPFPRSSFHPPLLTASWPPKASVVATLRQTVKSSVSISPTQGAQASGSSSHMPSLAPSLPFALWLLRPGHPPPQGLPAQLLTLRCSLTSSPPTCTPHVNSRSATVSADKPTINNEIKNEPLINHLLRKRSGLSWCLPEHPPLPSAPHSQPSRLLAVLLVHHAYFIPDCKPLLPSPLSTFNLIIRASLLPTATCTNLDTRNTGFYYFRLK